METTTMDDVRRANAARGHHWFEPGTMRFFRSRAGDTLYGGRYFVSSEQIVHSNGARAARRYSVREAHADGRISTVGDFQAWPTRGAAVSEIRRLLSREDARRPLSLEDRAMTTGETSHKSGPSRPVRVSRKS